MPTRLERRRNDAAFLVRIFDDELGKSTTAEDLSALKHVVSGLSELLIVEAVKHRVKSSNPKAFSGLSEAQKYYYKTLNSLSMVGARTFLRTVCMQTHQPMHDWLHV